MDQGDPRLNQNAPKTQMLDTDTDESEVEPIGSNQVIYTDVGKVSSEHSRQSRVHQVMAETGIPQIKDTSEKEFNRMESWPLNPERSEDIQLPENDSTEEDETTHRILHHESPDFAVASGLVRTEGKKILLGENTMPDLIDSSGTPEPAEAGLIKTCAAPK